MLQSSADKKILFELPASLLNTQEGAFLIALTEKWVPAVRSYFLDLFRSVSEENENLADESRLPKIVFDAAQSRPAQAVFGDFSEEECRIKLSDLGKETVLTGRDRALYEFVESMLDSADRIGPALPKLLSSYWGSFTPFAREVIKIAARLKCVRETGSAFETETKEIRIFYKTFGEQDPEMMEMYLKRALAGELFKAFIFDLIPEFKVLNSLKAAVIIDASAEFFSYLFCQETSAQKIVADLPYEWRRALFTSDPYAKAWFFLHEGLEAWPERSVGQAKQLLEDVITCAMANIPDAYDRLIPDDYRVTIGGRKRVLADENAVKSVSYRREKNFWGLPGVKITITGDPAGWRNMDDPFPQIHPLRPSDVNAFFDGIQQFDFNDHQEGAAESDTPKAEIRVSYKSGETQICSGFFGKIPEGVRYVEAWLGKQRILG